MGTQFRVWFTNVTGCAIGISDISLFLTVDADTETKALDIALEQAQVINEKSGLPPHGIRVTESELRKLALVQPIHRGA